ncbi:MAG: V-type ATPase 116kDa subunit family protein, partial [Oscillospiraceae bacterium]|nr:V-type ATPase 116kDa subunit family protein [Oscillospiraceae bacterium]
EQAVTLIRHLQGLDMPFDQLFASRYVKVRFGRLPADSYEKLSFYDNKTFFFEVLDRDDTGCWGVYFAPNAKIAVVDDIFRSLYFQRLRVPDYAHSEPEEAIRNITDTLTGERQRLQEVSERLGSIRDGEQDCLNRCYTALKSADDAFGIRRYVAVVNNRFYLEGFVPAGSAHLMQEAMEGLRSVSVTLQPADANPSLTPPTKLKNGWFARPFEMFVKMYGMPSYYEYDPTLLVALTYTLLFGIMFGDLGQGFVVWLAGLVMSKVKKMDFGKILERLGISSMVFGFAYGSVFGLEHLLDPVFRLMGFAEKPIEVFDGPTTSKILLAAIFLGVAIIAVSMVMNIVTGLRHKDYEKAIFGNNGIAGLVLYLGAVAAVALTMLTTINVLNPVFIILVIVIPVVLIFLREPLSKLCAKRKDLKPEDGVGSFIIENIFELLEYILSYLSNSMSFLRVGGFVLSHAGMMAVVLSLSEMMSGGGSVVVMILGNLFVMCLEGLIAGIQVLRLEFYEIFSRFYSGDGKEYEPAAMSCKLS